MIARRSVRLATAMRRPKTGRERRSGVNSESAIERKVGRGRRTLHPGYIVRMALFLSPKTHAKQWLDVRRQGNLVPCGYCGKWASSNFLLTR